MIPGDESGTSEDYARFPAIEERIGEDPGRFLDRELLERGSGETTGTSQMLVRARIRGIDYAEVARAWIAVERRLHNREPILMLLEDRLEWLEEHGDRDERLDLEAAHERAQAQVTERGLEFYRGLSKSAPRTTCELQWGTLSERLVERAAARTDGGEPGGEP